MQANVYTCMTLAYMWIKLYIYIKQLYTYLSAVYWCENDRFLRYWNVSCRGFTDALILQH